MRMTEYWSSDLSSRSKFHLIIHAFLLIESHDPGEVTPTFSLCSDVCERGGAGEIMLLQVSGVVPLRVSRVSTSAWDVHADHVPQVGL